MSGSGELEVLVQQALAREKEQGTGVVVTQGHDCQAPTGQYNKGLAAGTTWKCSCGRTFRKLPKRLYSGWSGAFIGLSENELVWQEVGVRKLSRRSSGRPLAQAITIVLSLLAATLVPIVLGVLVDINWLHLLWLTVTIYISGSLYLWAGGGSKRWRNG